MFTNYITYLNVLHEHRCLPQDAYVFVWDQKHQFMMKSERCAKLCGSAACQENGKVSLYLPSFHYLMLIQVLSLFYTMHTIIFFYRSLGYGAWESQVDGQNFQSIPQRLSHTITVLNYKSSALSFVVFTNNHCACMISRCGSCRMGPETNSTGLGWVEGRMENKKQLSCRTHGAISH